MWILTVLLNKGIQYIILFPHTFSLFFLVPNEVLLTDLKWSRGRCGEEKLEDNIGPWQHTRLSFWIDFPCLTLFSTKWHCTQHFPISGNPFAVLQNLWSNCRELLWNHHHHHLIFVKDSSLPIPTDGSIKQRKHYRRSCWHKVFYLRGRVQYSHRRLRIILASSLIKWT